MQIGIRDPDPQHWKKIKGTVSRDRNKVWHQEEEKGQCNGDLK
jgi:hypothetical protein